MVGTIKKSTETMSFTYIFQESSPALRRRVSISAQIFAYGGFADVDTQFEQLAVYLWRAPERVLATHPADELPYVLCYGWPPRLTMATLPRPKKTKSLALPANGRFGLYHHQCASPFRPIAG